MNERLLNALNGKAELYPCVIEERYPRVFTKIIEACDTKHFEACLLDLMVDNSGGARQGFPPEAATEIVRMSNYLHALQARSNKASAWDNIPEFKRIEVERLGYSFTPQGFLKAIDNNGMEAVHVFLSYGIDLEVKDERGWTPLMISTANGNEELSLLLIRRGARLMARDINGFTPLHWAAYSGMTIVVELLILKEADINAQSQFGWTPLMQACTRGQLAVCAALVASGANVNLANSEGLTALQIAKNKGHNAIVELLLTQRAEDTEISEELSKMQLL
jgi:hypothetical protein